MIWKCVWVCITFAVYIFALYLSKWIMSVCYRFDFEHPVLDSKVKCVSVCISVCIISDLLLLIIWLEWLLVRLARTCVNWLVFYMLDYSFRKRNKTKSKKWGHKKQKRKGIYKKPLKMEFTSRTLIFVLLWLLELVPFVVAVCYCFALTIYRNQQNGSIKKGEHSPKTILQKMI